MQFHKFKTYLAVLPLPARHLAFPHQCNSNFSQKIWWRPLRTNQGWPLVSLSWKAQSPTHIYKVSHQALQNIQTSSSSFGRGLGVWALGTYKERKWRDMVILEMGRRQRQRKGLRENTEKLDICVTQSLRTGDLYLLRESLHSAAETLLPQKTGCSPRFGLLLSPQPALELAHCRTRLIALHCRFLHT